MSDQIRILQTNVANDILVKFDTPIETFQIAPLAVGIYWSVYGVSFLEIGCFNFIFIKDYLQAYCYRMFRTPNDEVVFDWICKKCMVEGGTRKLWVVCGWLCLVRIVG